MTNMKCTSSHTHTHSLPNFSAIQSNKVNVFNLPYSPCMKIMFNIGLFNYISHQRETNPMLTNHLLAYWSALRKQSSQPFITS